MASKNQDLKMLTSRYRKNSQQSINPLSMALNGVIDAAVMGGVVNYTKVSITCFRGCFPQQCFTRWTYKETFAETLRIINISAAMFPNLPRTLGHQDYLGRFNVNVTVSRDDVMYKTIVDVKHN